jgi:hypothetical protein
MPNTLSPSSGPAETRARDQEHFDLLETLRAYVTLRGHANATGLRCLNGKRPDLVSLDPSGHLIVWEVKTRYVALERHLSWQKYHTSAHRLVMVYPAGLDLSSWDLATWLPRHRSADDCGALLLSETQVCRFAPGRLLNPEPTAHCHLTGALIRKSGYPLPSTSAPA